MLPYNWTPTPTPDAIVCGGPGDGGYIVSKASIEAADVLISMGLNDDWRFEADYLKLHPAGQVVCFDHTVDAKFWVQHAANNIIRFRPHRLVKFFQYSAFFGGKNAVHRKRMIGYEQTGAVSLDAIVEEFPGRRLFLKCDIEGSEYRILDQIARHGPSLAGVVIELHDIDLHRDRVDWLFKELQRDLQLIALHPNNIGGIDGNGDPLVIEASFVHKSLIPDGLGKVIDLPPNGRKYPPIELKFEDAPEKLVKPLAT